MKTAAEKRGAKVIGYKIILGVAIGAAALSNATQDLNHLQDLSDNVWHLGSQLLDAGVFAFHSKQRIQSCRIQPEYVVGVSCKHVPIR